MMRVSGEKIVSGIVGTQSLMCFEVWCDYVYANA